MAGVLLVPVRQDDHWRVQLAWANGKTRYCGKFGSQPEAERWIAEHHWLTEQIVAETTQQKLRQPGVSSETLERRPLHGQGNATASASSLERAAKKPFPLPLPCR